MTNMETFTTTYTEKLREAHTAHPDQYPWPIANVPKVAANMTKALATGEGNKDGYGIRNTCKALGIPYTYAGIKSYLSGGPTP